MIQCGYPDFTLLLRNSPQAIAKICGNNNGICGEVRFYQTACGVILFAQVYGLPRGRDFCQTPIFGFHIHEGAHCTGDCKDPFSGAGMHYNPYDCPHPCHAGDLPPLFGANGCAVCAVLTDRFSVDEIIGKTVIIHSSPDDFTSQPSGNAGTKMACGEIVPYFGGGNACRCHPRFHKQNRT